MSDRRAVTTALWPALAVAALALAPPAQANLALTVSDSGGVIAACNATDGGTGTLSKGCANPNFSQIIVTGVGAPLIPAPGLFASQISLTSGNLTGADTLTIDVAQTGLSFAAGTVAVNLTVGGMGPAPVTLTALGPGGGVLLSQTFTEPGHVSGAIPIAAGSSDNARFVLQFSGPNQTVNALISLIAQSTATLSDAQQPGSVVVYPKFINELFNGGSPIIVDGVSVPQTEIEIGAVCPPAFVAGGGFCAEHQPVKIRFHWVCPGTEGMNSNICPEEDFEVNITVPGKLAFSANGLAINLNSPPLVPAPPCARGYLIGWVISPTNDLPVKFDGLVGNAVIRNPNLAAGPNAGMSTGLSAYNAIPIQAAAGIPTAPLFAPIPGAADGTLRFGVANGYTTVTGVQIGDVRFDRITSSSALAIAPNILSRTNLNFLTLDVLSNQPNDPVFINLNFWNESLGLAVGSSNPAFEHLTSTFREFVCWDQVPLSALAGGNLTQTFQGTRKGIVIAGPANKMRDGNAPGDAPGPVTLIGLVETIEGTAANDFLERKYNFNMSNDSNPVPTAFVP